MRTWMEPATMSAYDPNWTSADVEAGGLAENNQGAFRTCREVAMIFYSSPEKMCDDIGNFVMTMRYITVCVGALIMALGPGSELSDTAIFEPPLVDLFLGPSEWLAVSLYAAMNASMCSCNCSMAVKDSRSATGPGELKTTFRSD